MRFADARILVFAKAPVPGFAKTRLIPALGAEGAAALQARLVRRTLAMATGSALAPVQLWVAGAPDDGFFTGLAAQFGCTLHRQHGLDLGARMEHALSSALAQARCAVLIGTDCPAMDGAYLGQALDALDKGADGVVGPAEDGGYVLIGLPRSEPALFRDIAWGTSRVLAQTRVRLARSGRRFQELDVQWDLDRVADLERLQASERLALTWKAGAL